MSTFTPSVTLPFSIPVTAGVVPTPFSLPPSQPPTPSNTVSANNNGPSSNVIDSGALYLYTFLATLVLLLSVSFAIVIRSLIVRRRRNRYIAEAIANGTWVPRGNLRDPGTKPSLFEAHVADLKHTAAQDELEWDAITPFSATYVNAPPTDITTDKTASTLTAPRSPIARLFNAIPIRRPARPRIHLPFPVSIPTTSTSVSTPTSGSASTVIPSDATSSASTLRVAVLIAMPSPHNASHARRTDNDDEEAIPHVEFGVTEVGVGSGSVPSSTSGIGPNLSPDSRNGDR